MTAAASDSLAGKVAIVTGGGSGIGRGCALRLAADGAKVGVFDLDPGNAKAVADEIAAAGGEAHPVTVDVTSREQIDAGVAEIKALYGAATILVTSAGREGFRRFLDITADQWNALVSVNLTGTFHSCQAVVPDMIEAHWGRIVTISSSSAQGGQPFMTHYSASKGGVITFTKSLALELGEFGITVNTIPPGFIITPMTERNAEKGRLGPGGLDAVIARTPVRRGGQSEDIAAACAFLCRDEASYVTGQIIGVNGGRTTTSTVF
ncbi:SDR family oxidoreductase [Frankia sp. AgB1.9]|uniref:SDR family NAD(P)-dependent oxidoreductase n=1 Tax=unclassified Frankia TaxID=2632575 RepID=UPI001933768E|nr:MULTISPECIES: SDR family NAD(P)-dependent oxidoreductase [unclassified Frankia]MBL7486612.1 SDR family oxidoreductase [Frankia sp. AgW1.1]MBL7552890.1 SDR family oxidoreductase [Frankia sp. AgB1.9]MBL7621083.1 SDR family oxidoreductase [Frankia sp. AgB1.8]